MPYERTTDLPDSVRDHLPSPTQDIYKEAFHSAFEQDGHDESRAHAIAWAAVKRQYHKGDDGDWHEGPNAAE